MAKCSIKSVASYTLITLSTLLPFGTVLNEEVATQKMAAVKSFKTDEALFSFFEGTGLYFGLSQPNYMPGSQIRHEQVYKNFFFNRPRNTIEHVGFEGSSLPVRDTAPLSRTSALSLMKQNGS